MASSIATWLHRKAAETWTPPFPQAVPSDAARYAAATPLRRILWRRLRRTLWLAATGQRRLERDRVGPADRRILWIHAGMPQVGDSLMDLACRGLLRDREVDLLIDPHLVPLYAHDDVFRHVHGDPADAAKNAYDLAIVLGVSSHNLGAKLRHFRALPWVSLHGFYTGPEFHRTLFAGYRLVQLLGGPAGETEAVAAACPHVVAGAAAVAAVDALALPDRFVALAVGGVRGWRTYARWAEVVAAMRAAGVGEPLVLVGAANGAAERDRILESAGAGVIDRVDRHSLPEVYEILRRATLAVCADGGLLHLANAARTPTVALFAERIDPGYRLTPANRSVAFHHPVEVSRIEPAAIAEAVARALREPIVGVRVIRG
jgi:heptosyltransferase-2